jgi:uncharacterized protein
MRWFSKKIFVKWLRILHRDLGYFFVGITLVYGISGIVMIQKKHGQDPAYATINERFQLPKHLDEKGLTEYWHRKIDGYELNRIFSDDQKIKVFLAGGIGEYDVQSGLLVFEVYKRRPLVHFINRMHFNQIKGWTFFANFFAASLIFFAISGLFIVSGKNGFLKRGIWFMVAGLLLVIIFMWL